MRRHLLALAEACPGDDGADCQLSTTFPALLPQGAGLAAWRGGPHARNTFDGQYLYVAACGKVLIGHHRPRAVANPYVTMAVDQRASSMKTRPTSCLPRWLSCASAGFWRATCLRSQC